MMIMCLETWRMRLRRRRNFPKPVKRDVENEIKTKEKLSKARKEVENLQAQKNAMEEELYQSQTAKEKLEQILKKQDTKYLDTTNRSLKAEVQAKI